MRVLYGVVGEGMGHATRSKVVIAHLLAQGHDVRAVVSGRAHAFLQKAFGARAIEIRGLEIRYDQGRMDRDGSLAKNLMNAPRMAVENAGAWQETGRFAPEMVITDFESFAHAWGYQHGLPIVSVDNQQVIARCRHDDAIIGADRVDFESTRAFVKMKLPGCAHYVVTTFFYPEIKEKYVEKTTLVPPILRDEILRAVPTVGDHVLVYQTSTSDTALLDVLAQFPEQRFTVYGLRRDEDRGHVQLKSFSEQGFVDDLASARAVVANGGLSLLGEALSLHKPVYVVPVAHQFEQVMNARYVVKLGYGMTSSAFDADTLGAFLTDAPHFARRVARDHRHDGNAKLFATLDALLAGISTG